jgi:uncharacterized phage-associated protein
MGLALRVGVVARTPVKNNQKEIVLSIFDELPEAWDYGPVFVSIFKQYRQLKLEALQNYTPSYEDTKGKNILQQRDDKIIKTILRAVVASPTIKQNSVILSDWSCKNGSPWDIARNCNHYSGFGVKIDLSKIRIYFNYLHKEDIFGLDLELLDKESDKIKLEYLRQYNTTHLL